MEQRKLFQLNSEKVTELQRLLEHPVMKEALSIVLQESIPKEPKLIPGVDMRDIVALSGAKSMGAEDFYKRLHNLCRVSDKVLRDIDKEYIQDARKRLFSTGLYTMEEITEAERLSMQPNNEQE